MITGEFGLLTRRKNYTSTSKDTYHPQDIATMAQSFRRRQYRSWNCKRKRVNKQSTLVWFSIPNSLHIKWQHRNPLLQKLRMGWQLSFLEHNYYRQNILPNFLWCVSPSLLRKWIWFHKLREFRKAYKHKRTKDCSSLERNSNIWVSFWKKRSTESNNYKPYTWHNIRLHIFVTFFGTDPNTIEATDNNFPKHIYTSAEDVHLMRLFNRGI